MAMAALAACGSKSKATYVQPNGLPLTGNQAIAMFLRDAYKAEEVFRALNNNGYTQSVADLKLGPLKGATVDIETIGDGFQIAATDAAAGVECDIYAPSSGLPFYRNAKRPMEPGCGGIATRK
jgi:hypothetical protein